MIVVVQAKERDSRYANLGHNQHGGELAAAPFLDRIRQYPHRGKPDGNQDKHDNGWEHVFDTGTTVVHTGADDGTNAVCQAQKAQQHKLHKCDYADLVPE